MERLNCWYFKMQRLILFVAIVLGFALAAGKAEDDAGFKGMYWSNSLKPPFGEIHETTGMKYLENWSHGGSVQIKNNFVRLTPDKPSRTGWIFNTASAPRDDWSVLIRFRISGQSESLSGDGFAFWYTASNSFNTGMLMGGTDSFVGIGVLFDSYANDELHRDVVVVASDGNEPVHLSGGKKFPGCESKFRRWEGRDDFNIDQESAAKISFVKSKVIVEIDDKGTGDFTTCVERDMVKFLPKDNLWKAQAHFAISAATGALHDNHDILEVITTSAEQFDRLMELHDEVAEAPPVVIKVDEENVTASDVGHHVNSLAYEVKDLDDRIQKLHHEIEHDVEKVMHRLEDLIEKLSNQEKRLELRVSELERKLSSDLYTQMETRLANLEQQIYKSIDNKQQYMAKHVAGSFNAAQTEARGWRTPFFIFMILVVLVLGYLIFTVVRINKKVSKDQRLFD